MTIETRIRAAIDRVREQSSSIPDIDRLFVSLKGEFRENGITGDPANGHWPNSKRFCASAARGSRILRKCGTI
jgi:hypothetical protein